MLVLNFPRLPISGNKWLILGDLIQLLLSIESGMILGINATTTFSILWMMLFTLCLLTVVLIYELWASPNTSCLLFLLIVVFVIRMIHWFLKYEFKIKVVCFSPSYWFKSFALSYAVTIQMCLRRSSGPDSISKGMTLWFLQTVQYRYFRRPNCLSMTQKIQDQ